MGSLEALLLHVWRLWSVMGVWAFWGLWELQGVRFFWGFWHFWGLWHFWGVWLWLRGLWSTATHTRETGRENLAEQTRKQVGQQEV